MSQSQYLIYASVAATLWSLLTVVYRLYIHPLAKVPGPKLAAISTWYEWYSNCVQPGTFFRKIQKWHEQYGRIVRIGPNEVHIDDSDWFEVFYSPSAKYDKDPWFYGLVGNHDSTFATVEHEVHRMKRSKMSPFFSKQNVDRSAPMIATVLKNTLDLFEAYRNTGEPLSIKDALKSFTADVVCEYSFATSMGFSRYSDFAGIHHLGLENYQHLFNWNRHIPKLAAVVASVPDWLTPYMNEPSQAAISFIKFVEAHVQVTVQGRKDEKSDSTRSIIREMYNSNLPAEYRTQQALRQEAVVLMSAGISTVARVVESGLFYILRDPAITKELVSEIRAYKPEQEGTLTRQDLEELPYLSAVVLECQRRHPVLSSRSPRINRTQDVTYDGHVIPKGTVIGMTVADVLLDDRIWGDGHEFRPSRWLEPGYKTKMQKYMVPFGRGSRNCVGQNLALAELYVLLGNFFRRFDAELFETGEAEIKTVRDCFEARPFDGSKGVRLLLT